MFMADKFPRAPLPVNKRADTAPVENVLARIRIREATFGPSTRSIANFVLEHPGKVVGMSVTELAEATGASDGSVINFCRQLGLSGFQQFKLSLAQETVKPVQFIHEDLQPSDDTAAVCRKMFSAGIQALRDTLSVLDPDAVAAAVKAIKAADRVEIYGIGSSAPIAEDAQYRMLRIGLNVKVVTDSHIQAISASLTGPHVVVLTISHSGATHETLASTRLAKEAGARTIVVTNFANSPLQSFADIKLFTMSRETKFRTEAMTSRIAQLCVLDALVAGIALDDYEHSVSVLQKTFNVLSLKRF